MPTSGSSRALTNVARNCAVIVAASVLALTSSCSSKGSTQPDATQSNGPVEISVSMQQTDVEHGDPTTWTIVKKFQEKYPNIKVDLSGQPVAQHDQTIAAGAQSGTLPTIFWVNNSDTMRKLGKAGALLDLDPIVQKSGLAPKMSSTVLQEFKGEDGKQYGLPQSALVTGLYYNKKVLTDNGLEAPQTFDDLVQIAGVLHAKGITTIANGANQSTYSVWSFLTCLDRYGYDQKIDDILAGKASFNDPDIVRFYESVAKLQKAGAFASNVSSQTYNQAVSDFSSGKAAFLDSGVWAAAPLQKTSIASNIGFWPGPTFTDGVGPQDIVMNVVGAPFSVSGKVKQGTAQYDAVEKFFDFYYSDQGQQIFAETGQPPVTTYKAELPASASIFKAVLDATTGKPAPRRQPDQYLTSSAQNALYDSIYGVIEGQLSPTEAAATAAKAIDGAGGK